MKKILLMFFVFCFSFPTFAKEMIKYTDRQDGVYVFEINTKKYGNKIKPVMTKKVMTPKKLYEDNCYELVVNGGFFDVKNGKSVSYVTIDGDVVSDVMDNVQLISSLKKQNRLEKVLSRSEFRVLENKRGKLKFDIAYHTDDIKKGYHIKHSLQAGPMINPTMDLVNEGFVVYEDDIVKSQSVDILKRRERTAIGLKGKKLYIVIFSKEHKVDAIEMRTYLTEKLKLKKAMAFDGGLSTALTSKNFSIGSMGKHQRCVKSFLVIER